MQKGGCCLEPTITCICVDMVIFKQHVEERSLYLVRIQTCTNIATFKKNDNRSQQCQLDSRMSLLKKVDATHIFRLLLQQSPKLIHSCGSLVETDKGKKVSHKTDYFAQKQPL